jgi:lincosamide nucleotidyltransferase A/C/D/E
MVDQPPAYTSYEEDSNPENFLMSSSEVLKIHEDLLALGVDIILDGGWGIDALLGEETRPHKDIDFLIEKQKVDTVIKYFSDLGYTLKRDPDVWWHFFLIKDGKQIDIHVINVNDNGDGIYGPPERGNFFPAESLRGIGSINGTSIRCLSTNYRINCLTKAFGIVTKDGYIPTSKDIEDIKKLCNKFNIALPEEFN